MRSSGKAEHDHAHLEQRFWWPLSGNVADSVSASPVPGKASRQSSTSLVRMAFCVLLLVSWQALDLLKNEKCDNVEFCVHHVLMWWCAVMSWCPHGLVTSVSLLAEHLPRCSNRAKSWKSPQKHCTEVPQAHFWAARKQRTISDSVRHPKNLNLGIQEEPTKQCLSELLSCLPPPSVWRTRLCQHTSCKKETEVCILQWEQREAFQLCFWQHKMDVYVTRHWLVLEAAAWDGRRLVSMTKEHQ